MTTATRNQAQKTDDLIEKCGYAAAAITLLPIPGVEIVAVMPIHVGMVVRIGDLYDVAVDRDTAMNMILRIGASVGLSLLGTTFARYTASFLLPVAGKLIAAPMVYAATLALGRVAQAHFERGCALTDAEIRDLYKGAHARAKRSFEPGKARTKEVNQAADEMGSPDAKEDGAERLTRLRALLDKGLIEQAEYDEAKRRVLSEL